MFGCSGTAIEFLTDWQIGDGLLRIVREARQQLTLVSPYNRHWGHLKREVEAAQRRGVAVAAYYRAEDPAHAPEYEGASITPVCMLHAKIYANEKVALVTTMNLVETSAAYSREVGLLVRDPKLRREIDEYVQSLADAAGTGRAAAPSSLVQQRAASRPAIATVQTPTDIAQLIAVSGFCIECGTTKEFDERRLLCGSCYGRYGRSVTHKICHRCGEEYPARVSDPLCQKCSIPDNAAVTT